jgi:hypothetical protein
LFAQHFANFLLDKGRISETDYALISEQQKKGRVKLGLIAVAENMLTKEQAEKLNALQRQTDRRFGDLAVEQGYLSAEQVDRLLEMQGNSYLRLVEILTENGILTLAEIEGCLKEYQAKHGFSDQDLQVLKSGELAETIPLFVRTDHPLAADYLGLAVRNVIRFIHNQPLLGKLAKTSAYSFGRLACQEVTGDHQLWLGFASSADELLEIASPFAKEDFSELDEDALDSVCEFINCINGLFATELSHRDVIVDMQPPSFARDQKLNSTAGFYVLPLTINGRQIDLIAAVDGKIEME